MRKQLSTATTLLYVGFIGRKKKRKNKQSFCSIDTKAFQTKMCFSKLQNSVRRPNFRRKKHDFRQKVNIDCTLAISYKSNTQ